MSGGGYRIIFLLFLGSGTFVNNICSGFYQGKWKYFKDIGTQSKDGNCLLASTEISQLPIYLLLHNMSPFHII